jgi:tagaturonate reductase
MGDLDETVLQFGGGNFLRAFADVFIDRTNQGPRPVGKVVVVQSTPGPRSEWINQQGGSYHVVTRGIEQGQTVDRSERVASISRALEAAGQWPQVLELAQSPALRFVVSNTTEAGLALDADEPALGGTPRSFPAKLLAVLLARRQAGLDGLTVLPCELVENNGDTLRGLVLRQGREWGVEEAALDWVKTACRWPNTLVDRIVSGRPAEHPLLDEDKLLTVGEPYALWAIQAADLGFVEDPAVRMVKDVEPYALRKVRLLNGAHTALVCKAGDQFETVRQAVADVGVRAWLEKLLLEELLPPVEGRIEGGAEFAAQVLERFANPFLDHRLADIALHHETKIGTRLLPTYGEFKEAFGQEPPLLAALLQRYL